MGGRNNPLLLIGSAISEVLDELEEDFDEAHKEMEV